MVPVTNLTAGKNGEFLRQRHDVKLCHRLRLERIGNWEFLALRSSSCRSIHVILDQLPKCWGNKTCQIQPVVGYMKNHVDVPSMTSDALCHEDAPPKVLVGLKAVMNWLVSYGGGTHKTGWFIAINK